MVIQNNQGSSAFFDPHQPLSPSSFIASPRSNSNNNSNKIQNNHGSATIFDEDDDDEAKSVGVTMTPRSLRLRETTTNKKKQLPAPVIIIISFVSLICFNEFYHSIHYTSSTLLMFQTAMKSAESEPTARARSTAAAITVMTSENISSSSSNNNNTSPSSSSESSSSRTYNSSRSRNNNIVVISKEYNDRHCWLEPAWGEIFMTKKNNPSQQVPSSLINLVQKDPDVLDYFQSIRKQLGKKDKKNDFCVGDDGSTKPSSFADELVLSTSITMGKTTVAPEIPATYLTCKNDDDDDKPTIIPQTNEHITSSSSSQILDEGLTVALLYYAQPSMLLRQLEAFHNYTESIRDKLTILIVDDGSPKGLRASEYIHLFNNNNNNNVTNNNRGLLRIRMVRITKDKDWNIGGARNLAFYLTDTSKVLLLDIDIMVPSKAMKRALSWPTTNSTHHNIAHRFNRKFKDGSKKIHPAVCVISREAYWENGGCDEDFVGHYGYTDVHFWYRWDFTNKMNKKKSDSFSASGGGNNTTTTTTIIEKNKKQKKINLRIDHDDTYLEQIKKNACDKTYMSNYTDFTKCVMAQAKLKLPNKGGNKNKALYKKKTESGCWSNKFLRFPWILER